MPGKIVNQRELGDIFGVSHQTMANWMREGMPTLTRGDRGQENQYDTAAVIEWFAAREVAKTGRESPRDVVLLLQAEKMRRELSLAAREVLTVQEVEDGWSRIVMAIRQELLAFPARLAPDLEAATNVTAKRDLLDEAIRRTLDRLSVIEADEALEPAHGDQGLRNAAREPMAFEGAQRGRSIEGATW